MVKKRRRITKADIKFVSLCTRGKNKMPVLYKSDGTVEIDTICKMSDQGELTVVVWPPNRADAEGDFIDDFNVLKDMAHSHARNGFSLDVQHNGKPLSKEDIYVAESFIIQTGDPRFQNWNDYEGQPVGDLTGGWAQVYNIQNRQLRKQYRKGLWNGVSLFGPATVEILDKSEEPQPRKKKMETEDLVKAIKAAFAPEPKQVTEEGLAKAVVTALTESGVLKKAEDRSAAVKKTRRGEPRAPRLTDYSPEGIGRFSLEKQAYELAKAIEAASDSEEADVDEIRDLCEDLVEVRKAMDESGLFETDEDVDDDDDGDGESGSLRKAKRMARRTRRGLGRGKGKDQLRKSEMADLLKGVDPAAIEACESKEELEALASAGEVLKFMNPAKEA